MTIAKAHHYAIDAANLLETCLQQLRETIALDTRKCHKSLVDMETCLVTTERLLLAYTCQQVDLEREAASNVFHLEEQDSDHEIPPTLLECIEIFKSVLQAKKQRQDLQSRHAVSFANSDTKQQSGGEASMEQQQQDSESGTNTRPTFDHSRSPVDSLLFRLIVTLQLCLVRIDDARFVITGRRRCDTNTTEPSSILIKAGVVGSICLLGVGSFWFLRPGSSRVNQISTRKFEESSGVFKLSAKVALVAYAGKVVVREWGNLWMTAKIKKSIADVEEWQQQWLLVQTTGSRRRSSLTEQKSQRLIEYAMSQSPKSSLWHSEGELRFLLVKRAMDLLYASVGTAVQATRRSETTNEGWMGWKLPMAAAAAASYYSFFDPSKRALEAVSSSSFDLIQYAWGMVSLPAIKQLSLQASRLLKGAAIAERITIAGVPCFVLSRDPSPDLAAALVREKRRKRNSITSSLSTIEEKSESEMNSSPSTNLQQDTPFRRTYPKKDFILHFTGGGFFAHTLASDIPFLLDWSGKTNAIVLCPEYALLPENAFPVALDQVTEVYASLVTGSSAELLGVEADRVIVTGESAGGNLAAALCVKLCLLQPDDTTEASNLVGETHYEMVTTLSGIRLPDAIMLSCPALNLTLDLSPSRVVGQEDPVLPSGLISAISDSYAPEGVDKKDPLVSPFYAPDTVLQQFPPILLFASSNDPLLDDSVDFNRRCRSLGVDSELGAVSYMPHAYWGLGTAGFPEAQQVQHECQDWLVRQFARGEAPDRESDEVNKEE